MRDDGTELRIGGEGRQLCLDRQASHSHACGATFSLIDFVLAKSCTHRGLTNKSPLICLTAGIKAFARGVRLLFVRRLSNLAFFSARDSTHPTIQPIRIQ